MLVCAGVACLPAGAAAQATRWAVEDASVTFVIRNAGLPVDGSFEGVELHVAFDPQAPEAGSLSGTVDPATIRTGIAFRDRHLQGREFFHVARYGPVQLTSVRLGRSADGFEGLFRLRIRDVERDVTIPFAFEGDGSHGMISGELTLDRLDYDVGERSIILSDEVRVTVSARLRRSG
jgi:polyisoprenoid-binding protein YceI